MLEMMTCRVLAVALVAALAACETEPAVEWSGVGYALDSCEPGRSGVEVTVAVSDGLVELDGCAWTMHDGTADVPQVCERDGARVDLVALEMWTTEGAGGLDILADVTGPRGACRVATHLDLSR